MYLPSHFEEKRLPVLHEAIEQVGLATLVSVAPEGLEASHVPMLLDREAGPLGTLYGHLARANRQGHGVGPELPVLAIFMGPDFYVSPSWYATKGQTGRVVPTWNYVAVHAHGRARFFEDPARLLALVTRLTERHEALRPRPWSVDDAPPDYIRASLGAIIGFELPIARLEGKWKMSQNRSGEDRAGVAEALEREGGATGADLAALVRSTSRE